MRELTFTRERSTSNLVPTHVKWINTTKNGVATTDGPYTRGVIGDSKVVYDVTGNNFQSRRKRGEIVMSAFHLERYARSMVPCALEYTVPEYDNLVQRFIGDLAYTADSESLYPSPYERVSEADIGLMADIALVKATAKMNEPAVVTGEIASDLVPTLGMLKSPFKASRELIKKIKASVKKSDWVYGSDRKMGYKAMANAWLEYRYAWKPLIMDVQSIAQEAGDLAARRNQRLVARASQVRTCNSQREALKANVGAGYSADVLGSLSHSVAVHAGVIYEISNHNSAQTGVTKLGLQLRDIPATAWELLPYSFVVDWFGNVGDWLQAITPQPSVTPLGSWVTVVKRSTQRTAVSNVEAIGYRPIIECGNGGSSEITKNIVTRYPNPSVATHPVLLRKPVSVLHLTDALSLTVGNIITGLGDLRH